MTRRRKPLCRFCHAKIIAGEAHPLDSRSHRRCLPPPENLFHTAAELDTAPVKYLDGDLSRIQVTVPASLDEYERLHAERERARAERTAKRDQSEVLGSDLARLVAAS